MNIIDLAFIAIAAWNGVIGYIRGLYLSAINVLGTGLAMVMAVRVHRPSAQTLMASVDHEFTGIIHTLPINLQVLTDMGYSDQVIEKWYFDSYNNGKTIQVQAFDYDRIIPGGEPGVVEVVEFFFANILLFVVTYIICYKICTIILNALESKGHFNTPRLLPQGIFNFFGSVLGVLQGGIMVGVWLFIINLVIPFGIPVNIAMEMNNSFLNTTMIDFINEILY